MALPAPSLQTWAVSICVCFKPFTRTPPEKARAEGHPSCRVGLRVCTQHWGPCSPSTPSPVSQNKSQSPSQSRRPCSVALRPPPHAPARRPCRLVPLLEAEKLSYRAQASACLAQTHKPQVQIPWLFARLLEFSYISCPAAAECVGWGSRRDKPCTWGPKFVRRPSP